MGVDADKTSKNMKYVSLVVLTLQNALLGLSMRYARTRPGDMFLSSTAVVMSEVVKLGVCLGLVYWEENRSFSKLLAAINSQIIKQPWDTFKVCVPSALYVFQNNLLYTSASNLDAATYQVTYQLKILTTAVFTVLILKRQLLTVQWYSLLVLLVGVVLVQMADTTSKASAPLPVEQNRLKGFSAALGACVLSGFAGIFFEKILKGSDISVWVRNVQMSFLSLPLGLFATFVNDYSDVSQKGFFFGYNNFVVYVIFLQALGGLIVAMVVKYADNILKGFATSLAIIISCIASIYLFDFLLSGQFVLGVLLVILSVYMYNYKPSDSQSRSKPLV